MIAIRVDANSHVASGHMFRCIAIAKQCRNLGRKVIFLLADDEYTLMLQKEEFEYKILHLKYDDWDYGIDRLVECLTELDVRCLIVDSYYVTANFFEKVSRATRVLYMDDLCKEKYRLDAVIHYSEWKEEPVLAPLYEGEAVEVYVGMKYMPLRQGFANGNDSKKRETDILITTGGSDTYHVTRELIKRILSNRDLCEMKILLVLGMMNEDSAEIRETCGEFPNVSVLQNVSNMDELMKDSRFAVTAGGTSVYELMASGVMFVSFAFSDDQALFCRHLDEHGHAIYAGDARDDFQQTIENLEKELLSMRWMDEAIRLQKVKENQTLVDGKGCERIAQIVINLCDKKREK